LVIGLPEYHPLCKDAEQRLKRMKGLLDLFAGRFQQVSGRAAEELSVSVFEPSFIPNVPPLARPATAQDGKKGRAIFHLAGRGRVARLRLPAFAVRKTDRRERPARLMIVQAEVGPDGATTYGVIGRHEVGVVPARELTLVREHDLLRDHWPAWVG